MRRFGKPIVAAAVAWLLTAGSASAQLLTEGFEDVAGLTGAGWFIQNNSTAPQGTSIFQGNSTVFPAQAGTPNSYAGANFQASTGGLGTETLSVWLLTPTIPLDNGAVVSFWTRTVSAVSFPDRLQVRFSTTGASTNVGTGPLDVGDFTNLLLDINPTYTTTGYPNDWANFSPVVNPFAPGTTGRIAFRYFVENGGPAGANSDFIGIDTLSITPVPEPTSLALVGLAGAGMAWRRLRKSAK